MIRTVGSCNICVPCLFLFFFLTDTIQLFHIRITICSFLLVQNFIDAAQNKFFLLICNDQNLLVIEVVLFHTYKLLPQRNLNTISLLMDSGVSFARILLM